MARIWLATIIAASPAPSALLTTRGGLSLPHLLPCVDARVDASIFFGELGMRPGASVCLASGCGKGAPRAPHGDPREIRGSGPNRTPVIEGTPDMAVFPDPVSLTICPYGRVLSRGRLASVETCLCRTGGELSEGRDRSPFRPADGQRGFDLETPRTRFLYAHQRRSSQRDPAHAAAALPAIHEATVSRAVDLSLAHDDREDRSRAVGRHRGLVEGGEPLPDATQGEREP